MLEVNAHIHTPFSFSAFESIEEALGSAAAEGVKVVGINDFYTGEGYVQWQEGCERRGLFPLFGIEFIALDKEAQAAGRRINDPGNPGRTYISGKGLRCPFALPEAEAAKLRSVREASRRQVESMCGRLNGHLRAVGAGISLDFEEIETTLTSGQVRERHLAKALRMAAGADASLYGRILGSPLRSDPGNAAAVENELRSRLLKAGGPAFVPEESDAFLPVDEVCRIIRAAGGIPTYPFLGDDAKGGFTDFEADLKKAAKELWHKGLRSVEFITSRNTTAMLERYARYLEDEGFIVTFGSEHNTPAMEPLRLRTRDSAELSDTLKAINWRGACAIAAHQAGLEGPGEGERLINSILNG